MKRALIVGVFVIMGTFLLAIVFAVWVTWTLVLPKFDGASDYLSPGLKMRLAIVRTVLADVPDRNPAALSDHLGVEVEEMTAAGRDAFLDGPALHVPLDGGETFLIRGDASFGSATVAALVLKDGRGLHLGRMDKITPLRPSMIAVWLAIVVMFALGAALLIFGPLTRRVRRLEDTARALSAGDLAARAPTNGATRDLALALNTLASRTERLIRSHEELLQAVSHELRTPAARIRFQLELQQAETDPAARARRGVALDRELDELDELIGELLSFSRLVADAPQWQRVPVDVGATLAEIVADACELEEKECTAMGESARVLGDARAFRRAFRNLVSNAMKAAKGRVEVGWSARGDEVCVTIDDDGDGVPADVRERVFAPFFVGDASRNRERGGVGLGLAIVQRIVELHGGRVEVGDAPIGGARFSVWWPRAS